MLDKALGLPVESVVFALLLITSVLVLPFWSWMSKHFYKNIAYIFGMFFGAVVQLLVFTVQPRQITYLLVLSVLAGISISTAHVLLDTFFRGD